MIKKEFDDDEGMNDHLRGLASGLGLIVPDFYNNLDAYSGTFDSH